MRASQAVRRPFGAYHLTKTPGSIYRIGLGTARNFHSSRPFFQNLVENVPIAARAFTEADLQLETRRNQQVKMAKRKETLGRKKTKQVAKVAERKLQPASEVQAESDPYFSAPPATPVTTLLVPLAPTPSAGQPLSSAPSPSLNPFPIPFDVHALHEPHSVRVLNLFSRLDAASVWADPGVSCSVYRDPSDLAPIRKIEFKGWTKAQIRAVLGDAGEGWCLTEEHRVEGVPESTPLSPVMSFVTDELEAISPAPTDLLTPPERFSVSAVINEENLSPMSLAQRVRSIIASTSTTTGQPVAFGSPMTPSNGILPQSPPRDPPNLPCPIPDSPISPLLYSPRCIEPSAPAQPSLRSTSEWLQSPATGSHEPPPQDGRGTEATKAGLNLMLCSHLIPQRDSLVEVADQRTSGSYPSPLYQGHATDDIHEQSESEDDEGFPTKSNMADRDQLPNISGFESVGISQWPRSRTEGKKQVETKEKKQADAEEREPKMKKKPVWIPSRTKLSLQRMWWGYKMSVGFRTSRFSGLLINPPSYLPPPVLEVLDNTQLVVSKRAGVCGLDIHTA